MITALAIVFVFGLMVIIHEFGHFIVAKWAGIKVLEFSFGFGPKLVGYQSKETLYAIRLIPLGGFVKLYGMDAEVDENGDAVIVPANDQKSYMNKPAWQRIAVIAAGPIMNFVLALILFIGVFAVVGIPTAATGNAVGSLIQGQPAMQAGIMPGDHIVAVNGVATPDWNTLTEAIHSKPNQLLKLTIQRGNSQKILSVRTEKDPPTGYGLIGITPIVQNQTVPITKAVKYGIEQTTGFTKTIITLLAQMITRKIPAQLGGPVAIAQAIGQGAHQGWADLLGLTGVLSIQLGLINLFPIPALDGSRIVFLLVEILRGRPLKPEKENFIHLIGFVLLLVAMLAVTYHDIVNLFIKAG